MKKIKDLKLKIKSYKLKYKKLLPVILLGIGLLLIVALSNQKTEKPLPSPTPSFQLRTLPSNLTEEEKFILTPPSADASTSAKQKHAEAVAKLAKDGSLVEIKDCQPSPLVLNIKQDSEFKINNKDNITHKIVIDSEHIYEIPAMGSLSIKARFKYGTGDYGYVCEDVGLVGFLH